MAEPSFSARVSSVIEARLSDPGFDVEALASALGLSRSWLHRRLVDDGGRPPGTRIRRARMRRAAVLLEASERSVGEVAVRVGYRDPAHFTRSFKRAFGMAPSRFRREKRRRIPPRSGEGNEKARVRNDGSIGLGPGRAG